MTTAANLVIAAFREGNLTPVGQPPTVAEQGEGLDVLNRLTLSAFGVTVGNKLRDWQAPTRQRTGSVSRAFPLQPAAGIALEPRFPLYPPMNARIVWDGSAQTLYFPERPQDGAVMAIALGSGAAASDAGALVLDGNGRTIAGADTYTVASREEFAAKRWFYRADLANWLTVAPVGLADEGLFPEDLDDLWIVGTAIRLAPRFGKTIAEATALRFREMQLVLRTRYQQSEAAPSGGSELVQGYESYGGPRTWME